MKRTLPMLCCMAALLLGSCGKRIVKSASVDIVPRPTSVEVGEGTFDLTGGTKICLQTDDPTLKYSADFFSGVVEKSLGQPLKTVSAEAAQPKAINVNLNPALATEEYTLNVEPGQIDIEAGSPQGVFYAFQSLRQMLPLPALQGEKAGVIELPAASIKDKPYFAHRGGMLDVCRHFFTVDEVKEFIDILSMHKLNRFHWHLTNDPGWRIEIKKYPELTKVGAWRPHKSLAPEDQDKAEGDGQPYGGFYTQDEIRDIVKYAGERFITVIPEIELPGHAESALAAYPYLGCRGEGYTVANIWGVKEDVFCAGKDSTFEFLENVLSEVVDLFPSEYIHIGGDECPKVRWAACPQCQKRIKDEKLKDEFELQSYFVQRIEKFLNGKGRKIIGWDEILEGGLSKTATVMSWRGSEGGIAAAKNGNTVIMTPNDYCYLDYYQTDKIENEPRGIGGYVPIEKVYQLDPYAGLSPDETKYILGIQGNLWTEFISEKDHLEYMLLPRLAAIAEVGWSYGNQNLPDFKKRVTSLAKIYDTKGYTYAKHMFAPDSTAVQ